MVVEIRHLVNNSADMNRLGMPEGLLDWEINTRRSPVRPRHFDLEEVRVL